MQIFQEILLIRSSQLRGVHFTRLAFAAAGIWSGSPVCPALAAPEVPYTARRLVLKQDFDRSCGLASLATVLQWGGYKISERDLLERARAIFSEDQSRRQAKLGFSVVELRQLVESLGLNISLEPRFLTEGQLIEVAQREVLIVYIVENSGRRGLGSGHFTILDGYSVRRGFLRADSADGTYQFESSKDFLASSEIWRDRTATQVLYVRSQGAPLATTLGISEADERTVSSVSKARIIRAVSPVPENKTQLTFLSGVSRTSASQGVGAGRVRLSSTALTNSITVRHGVLQNLDLAVSLATSAEKSVLIVPTGERLPIHNAQIVGPLTVSISGARRISKDMMLLGGASAAISSRAKLEGVSATVGAAWSVTDNLTLLARSTMGRVSEEGTLTPRVTHSATASVGMLHKINRRWWLSAEGVSILPLRSASQPILVANISAEREFSSRWAAGPFISAHVGAGNVRGAALGFSLSYLLPRRDAGRLGSRVARSIGKQAE